MGAEITRLGKGIDAVCWCAAHKGPGESAPFLLLYCLITPSTNSPPWFPWPHLEGQRHAQVLLAHAHHTGIGAHNQARVVCRARRVKDSQR